MIPEKINASIVAKIPMLFNWTSFAMLVYIKYIFGALIPHEKCVFLDTKPGHDGRP